MLNDLLLLSEGNPNRILLGTLPEAGSLCSDLQGVP